MLPNTRRVAGVFRLLLRTGTGLQFCRFIVMSHGSVIVIVCRRPAGCLDAVMSNDAVLLQLIAMTTTETK